MRFVDSHAHLCLEAFDADREAVLARARQAGMTRLLCIGSMVGDAEAARDLAERHPDVFFAAGLHPHDARHWTEAIRDRLDSLASHPRFLALGEIGLDYHYNHSPPEAQRDVFRAQIRLARERGVPIVIHTREAHDDTLRILSEEKASEAGGVFHCFSGNTAMAEFAVSHGFRVSFSGSLTFKNSAALREIAAHLQAEALLTETDSPFLSPHPHRGKRNEPARTADVVACLAEIRGVTPEAMGEQTCRNFQLAFPRLRGEPFKS
ncbi:MAG TPA: TatD family hydrolase [Candidatus Polarisedimenticolia bacterium]|nr:TatD family hydrolase [Candidatus Polarisedimenticolia bacterium]